MLINVHILTLGFFFQKWCRRYNIRGGELSTCGIANDLDSPASYVKLKGHQKQQKKKSIKRILRLKQTKPQLYIREHYKNVKR